MGKGQKLVIIFIGLIVAFMALYYSNNYFIDKGVAPTIAVSYALVVFLAVLGAFGLIAVKVNL